jgi:hypothetical protein
VGEPKMTAESLLGPVAEGDVVLDAAHFMGVLRSAAGSLLKYERYATLYGAPTYVADASACRVFVDRGRALRAIERVMARVAELERERDANSVLDVLARGATALVSNLAKAIGSEATDPEFLLAHAEALKARVTELERERDEARKQQRTLRQRIEAILVDEGCDCSCWDDESSDCQHGEPHRCPVEERCTVCRVEAALAKEAQT